MSCLPADFYERPVLDVARDLIGCTVHFRGASGVIVETEAYHQDEPACHAYVGLTPRTRVLFGPAGRSYVYRSYGVHALLNAVCEREGVGAGVLIRALSPLAGIARMRARRGFDSAPGSSPRARRDEELCSGPGKLTQAFGVGLAENDRSLTDGPVQIQPAAGAWLAVPVARGPRVGITRATDLPWRFCVVGDPNVSRPRPPAVIPSRARTRAWARDQAEPRDLPQAADSRAQARALSQRTDSRAREQARTPVSRSG
jgi:DNA-3-methyladenine glycosylase